MYYHAKIKNFIKGPDVFLMLFDKKEQDLQRSISTKHVCMFSSKQVRVSVTIMYGNEAV